MAAKQEKDEKPSHWGLYGMGSTQVMLCCMSLIPGWVLLLLIYPITMVIYPLAKAQSKGVCGNLQALFPNSSPLIRYWRGYLVFVQFGKVYLDYLWHIHFKRRVKWSVVGGEHFEELCNEESGVLLFTVHSGNYDIAASLMAEKFQRPLHIVRLPEKSADMQKMRKDELESQAGASMLHIHYNKPNSHLGVELLRILQQGEIVAVQGDRIIGKVSSQEVTLGELAYRIPKGPLALAFATKVPCYSLFVTRLGRMHYQVETTKCFAQAGHGLSKVKLAEAWLKLFQSFLIKNWKQWLVFEQIVFRKK